MRVLLLQSPTGRREPEIFPLGLAYLAGAVDAHTVRALDLAALTKPREALIKALRDYSPDVVAVSLRNIDDSAYPRTHSYVEPFSELMDWLSGYSGIVVVGGTGFSIYPQQVLERHPRIDYGVIGEAETALGDLLDRLESGRRPSKRLVHGDRSKLDELPVPRYDILDLSLYPMDYSIGVQSRRGCPFGCRYCTYGYLGGSSFRVRPVEDVVADIRSLFGLGVRTFSFVDSVFNHPSEYMRRLVGALTESGLKMRWSAWLDTDVSSEELEMLAAAGCDKVDLSPDALGSRGLRLLGKRGSFRETLETLSRARRLGMFATVNLFQGNPGEEGLLPLLAKLLFMVWARVRYGWRRTVVHIGTIRVYRHSPMADDMREEGKVAADCDFFEPVFHRSRPAADFVYRAFQWVRRLRHG